MIYFSVLKRGFQVPAVILRKLSVASGEQGNGQSQGRCHIAQLRPSLDPACDPARSPTTGQQHMRFSYPL